MPDPLQAPLSPLPAPRSMTFASARRRRTAHLVAQAVLVLTLVAGLNYLATRHAWRLDLSRHARHSLSPETRSYLRELSAPVHIVVTLDEETAEDNVAQAARDVRTLLRDYVEASAVNPAAPVTFEFIDIYKNRAAALKHGIQEPNTIVVICGGKPRVVRITELYRVKNGEKVAFTGEQAFTAAILDVTRAKKEKIYFLAGHGEMDPSDSDPDRGLSVLAQELALRNFDLAIHDLASSRELPSDASLFIIAAPQGRYGPEAQELLRRHLSTSAGRVLLLLNPGNRHGLDDLLFDWGVLADDVLILDQGPDGRADSGDLVLYPAASEHSIIQFLHDNKIAVRFGPTRSVRADPGRSLDPGLSVLPLVVTSATAWGERAFRPLGTPSFDPATDLAPRLSAATASERATPKGTLPFTVRSGRLVVFGNGDWLANSSLAANGNAILAFAAINWLADRDTQLQLPPRPIEKFQLSLTTAQLGRLRLTLLLALPAAAGLLGLLVYWNRRR
ncbi:MAG: GldG family protein [Burkholderiales bacterium]|nr:GldG family protein [Opitutaceae bacterium]